jgi:hypothetical protein
MLNNYSTWFHISKQQLPSFGMIDALESLNADDADQLVDLLNLRDLIAMKVKPLPLAIAWKPQCKIHLRFVTEMKCS